MYRSPNPTLRPDDSPGHGKGRTRARVACVVAFVSAVGCVSSNDTLEWGGAARWDSRAQSTVEARDPALPDLSARPALSVLLGLALARNPDIAAAQARATAAREEPRLGRSLPDPEFLLGWYATPVETRVGPQEASLGIRQNIPYPGKLSTRGEIGEARSRHHDVLYEITVRDVLVEVVRSAHELAYLDQAKDISARIGELLERYVAAAAGQPTGSPLNELFRAETQRSQLDNDRVVLQELRAAEAENLRSLLDLPAGTAIGTPGVGTAPPVRASFEELAAIAREHNHEIRAAGLATEVAALRLRLARKDRLPDFRLGYTQILTGELASALGQPAGSGDDAQVVYFGLTLPLWVSKNSAKVRRARALERAAALGQRGAALRVRRRLAKAWFDIGNAQRLVRLYEDVLIPRSEKAARTAEDLRASGKGTLAGALETIAVLHNFRLAAARARADLGQAVAQLESLLGRPLTLDRKAGGE